ncbi:MAG: hypothetical protein AAGG08_13100 [Actinomycetota bacterium]
MRPDNSITVLWAAKGGSGTTVTTAAAAVNSPDDVVIVDLDGAMTDVLGTTWPTVGLDDWLLGDPAEPLDQLLIDVDATTRLLPTRSPVDLDQVSGERVDGLESWMRSTRSTVLIDAGTGPPAGALLEVADRNLIVTRACYLAVMNGVRIDRQSDGVVLIAEPGRSLNASSIERALDAPIVTTIDHHPSIARSVDAGLLTAGHRHLTRTTKPITQPTAEPTALDRWRDIDPRRHSPDIDFGMRWRSSDSSDTWRISWNSGSGTLYATNPEESVVEDLGSFLSADDAAARLVGWGQLHRDPAGFDQVRAQLSRSSIASAPPHLGPTIGP